MLSLCSYSRLVFIFPPLLSIVAFVPAHTYGSHAYFWNLVTYAFVETNVLLFAVDAAALFIFLPIFERMWGATETACFFFSCVASAALILLISLVACFALTLNWEVLQVCTQLAHARAQEFSCQLNSPSTLDFRLPLVVCSSSLLKYTPKTKSSASQANICPGLTLVTPPLFIFRYHPLKSSSEAMCSGVLRAQGYQRRCIRSFARSLWRCCRYDFPRLLTQACNSIQQHSNRPCVC
jgi:hypothetical protein